MHIRLGVIALPLLFAAACSSAQTQTSSEEVQGMAVTSPGDVATGGVVPLGPVAPPQDVLTQHNDGMRTGAMLGETTLTPANVRTNTFGEAFRRNVDGMILAQPLFVKDLLWGYRRLPIPVGVETAAAVPVSDAVIRGIPIYHDVVYVVTERNTVYAFDSNDTSTDPNGGVLNVRTNVEPAEDGGPGTAIGPSMCGEWYGDTRPYVGITGTPAIDKAQGWMYFAARSTNNGGSWVLHKISLQTLADVGSPQPITAPGFDPNWHLNRPGLLLANGKVYVAFGTKTCDAAPYHGFVMSYDATTLAPTGYFNTSPGQGYAGIWASGNGLASNEAGDIFFETGNGNVDYAAGVYGDSFIKLAQAGTSLSLAGVYTPPNWGNLAHGDTDLGSGGPMVLPGTGKLIGGGKEGVWYPLLQSTMTEFQPHFVAASNTYHLASDYSTECKLDRASVCNVNADTTFNANTGVTTACYVPTDQYDCDEHTGPNIHAGPVFWPSADPSFGLIYQWAEKDYIRAYRYVYATGQVDTTAYLTSWNRTSDGMAAGALSLSANGDHDGILWASVPKADAQWYSRTGRLIAYDAKTLKEIWRDDSEIPQGKFQFPTVANGKIVRATSNKQVIFYANHACVPNADPCGAHDCGTASDGCGTTVACGKCTLGEVCAFGYCQEKPHVCKPPLHWCEDMGCTLGFCQ